MPPLKAETSPRLRSSVGWLARPTRPGRWPADSRVRISRTPIGLPSNPDRAVTVMPTMPHLPRCLPARSSPSSNLGAAILANTDHLVLAGPYHRNQAGNIAALELQMAPPDTARGLLGTHGIDYVAVCPGQFRDRAFFSPAGAPEGLLALLAAGDAPDWLREADAPGRQCQPHCLPVAMSVRLMRAISPS